MEGLIVPMWKKFLPNKTSALFQKRMLHEHMKFAGVKPRDQTELLAALGNLQESIYRLDSYSERVWNVERPILDDLWGFIYDTIGLFGLSRREAGELSSQIQIYQNIELALRSGISASTVSIEKFYVTKTCDVRLSRLLIEKHAERKESTILNPMWHCFDTISEVLDDLEDIKEDQTTFNCNRFIILYYEKGRHKAFNEYWRFIESLEQEAIRLASLAKSFDLKEGFRICAEILKIAYATKVEIWRVMGKPGSVPAVVQRLRQENSASQHRDYGQFK
jgi:hypothetical protein